MSAHQQLRVSNISPLLIFVKRGHHGTRAAKGQMTRIGEAVPHSPPEASRTVTGLKQKFEWSPLESELVPQLMFQIAYKRWSEAFGVVHEGNDRWRFNRYLGSIEQLQLTSTPIVRRPT